MSEPLSTPALPASPVDRSWRRAGLCALMATALFVGLLFRLDRCRDDLWVDELHTAWVVDGGWGEVAARAAIGNQAPLYYYATKVVTTLFGLSEPSLRLLPMLSGIALCLTAAWYVKNETGDLPGALLALTCVSLDRTCIHFSSEARPYALLQLVSAWLLIAMLRADRRWSAFWLRSLLAAVAMQLQFTAILFLAPVYAARGVQVLLLREERRSALFVFAAEITLVALLVAPLAPLLLEVAGRRDAWRSFVPSPTLLGMAGLLPGGPALLAFAAFLRFGRVDKSLLPQSNLIVLAWAAVAPAILAVGLDWLEIASLFLRRYLLACFWPLLVLPGVLLSALRGWVKVFAFLTILVTATLMNGHWAPRRWESGRLTPSRNEQWRQATRQVHTLDPQGELPLYVVAGLIESRRLGSHPDPLLREYCACPVATIYCVPHTDEQILPLSSVVPAAPSPDVIERVVHQRGALWLIRLPPERAGAWQRYLERVRQAAERRSPGDWRLNFHPYSGIFLLELRLKVR